jgi:hypothetical protein
MIKRARVVSIERAGALTAVVLDGLLNIQVGKYLKHGTKVWAVIKRHWVSKTHVSLILHAVSGGLPEIGQTVEVLTDEEPVISDQITEVTDAVSPNFMNGQVFHFISVRYLSKIEVNDVLSDDDASWLVITSNYSRGGSEMFLCVQGIRTSQLLPSIGTKLTIHHKPTSSLPLLAPLPKFEDSDSEIRPVNFEEEPESETHTETEKKGKGKKKKENKQLAPKSIVPTKIHENITKIPEES